MIKRCIDIVGASLGLLLLALPMLLIALAIKFDSPSTTATVRPLILRVTGIRRAVCPSNHCAAIPSEVFTNEGDWGGVSVVIARCPAKRIQPPHPLSRC